MLLIKLSGKVELLVMLNWCGDCSTHIDVTLLCCGDCLTLVTFIVDVWSFCGVSSTLRVWCFCGVCSMLEVVLENCVDCSTQGELSEDSLSSVLITLSILYSVFVLIFWIACKLLPKSLDTAWLTSLTFFDFKSRIVSANKRNSGSLHKMFLVFSLSFSLYKEGWTLERCTHNPDSKPVKNLEWWHLNNRLCSSGGSLVQ